MFTFPMSLFSLFLSLQFAQSFCMCSSIWNYKQECLICLVCPNGVYVFFRNNLDLSNLFTRSNLFHTFRMNDWIFRSSEKETQKESMKNKTKQKTNRRKIKGKQLNEWATSKNIFCFSRNVCLLTVCEYFPYNVNSNGKNSTDWRHSNGFASQL